MKTAGATRVADTYARCVLELAQAAPDGGQAVQRDLGMLSVVLSEQPQFWAFLISPYFSESAKQDLIRKAFAAKVDRLTLNFLLVVVAHRREAMLKEMIDRYEHLSRAASGRQEVAVTVARALDGQQQGKLSTDLSAALSAEVDLDVRVDPSILGGIVIRYAGRKVDNSIRGRLNRVMGEIARLQREHKEHV